MNISWQRDCGLNPKFEVNNQQTIKKHVFTKTNPKIDTEIQEQEYQKFKAEMKQYNFLRFLRRSRQWLNWSA